MTSDLALYADLLDDIKTRIRHAQIKATLCDRFVDKRSRTHDQMVQAARSGRQNIAKGSK